MNKINSLNILLLILFCNFLNAQYYNESIGVDSIYNFNNNDLDTIFIENPYISINDSDIVLLHQSKGLEINPLTGNIISDYGYVGKFEIYVVIKRINNQVIVRNISRDVTDTFRPFGLQLVKVGKYSDITTSKVIKNTIIAEPWNGKKGGIICIIADTLTLESNINASGAGFRGATPTIHNQVRCWALDTSNIGKLYLPESRSHWSGRKGESPVITDTLYSRGRGHLFSGGGGGNGFHSGGGGGGSYFSGGRGGYEALVCDSTHSLIGGSGGIGMGLGLLFDNAPRVTFGGGGGSSTRQTGNTSSKGGNGGGIIIILANVLKGNNFSIIANGESVTDTCTGGAGGGGAGGTIVLDVNQYLGKVNVFLNGGNGGSVQLTSKPGGMGGGGAGGYLRINTLTKSDSINLFYNGGFPGNNFPPHKLNKNASAGSIGFTKGNFIMPVRDFLFNLMPANQEICAGDIPKPIQASIPKGSSNIFKYVWRFSYDKINWTIIDTATRVTYQPPALFNTTYYQRIVHAVNINQNILVSDTSHIYTIKVLPAIINNTIYTDTFAICKGKPMPLIIGSSPSGGNETFSYQWFDSISGQSNWKPAIGISNAKNYKPNYTDTVFLRRLITSGACKSYSNILSIQVLPQIKNKLITDTQWISLGKTFDPIEGESATGGNGNYLYVWQKSDNAITWTSIDSSTNNKTIYVNTPAKPDTIFYRRIVYSGLFNTCIDTTNALPLYLLDSIQNNIIQGSSTICAKTSPNSFVGTQPKGGDGKYLYVWQSSNNNNDWTTIYETTDTIFNPGILFQDSYFRRIVISGRKNACKDTSNIIFVKTIPAIENNFILHPSDTIICFNQDAGYLLGSTPSMGENEYQYIWEYAIDQNYMPAWGNNSDKYFSVGTLNLTTYFRRKVISGICTSYSNTVTVKVLPLLTNNTIFSDTTLCKYTKPNTLVGTKPSGGDSLDYRYNWFYSNNQIDWQPCQGISQYKDYQPSTLETVTYFKRIVTSGPHNVCTDTSNIITINIYDLPEVAMSSFIDSICLGQTFNLNITLSGNPPFKVKYTDSYAIFDSTFSNEGNIVWNFKPYRAGIFNYTLVHVVDRNGCYPKHYSGFGKLHVFETPNAYAGIDTAVCGLEVKLNANKNIGTGTWFATPSVEFEKGLHEPLNIAKAKLYGTHQFTWKLNNGGCIDSSTIQITFYQPPPNPLVGENQKGPFLFKTHLKAYLPIFGTGYWTTPDTTILIEDPYNPETKVENLKFGKNYFQWYVKHGVCEAASDTLIVEVEDLKIPEGFSPNYDGINDNFFIKGLENVEKAELIILNKWGKEVYHNKNYKNNWDGTFKGSPLPFDTYYYILNVIGRTYKGYLIIKR